MTDQCAKCKLRGYLEKCEAVECGHHENWYSNELKAQLAAAEQRAAQAEGKLEQYEHNVPVWHGLIREVLGVHDEAPMRFDYYATIIGKLRHEHEIWDKHSLCEIVERAEKAEQRNAELLAECREAEATVAELMDVERDAVRECERIALCHFDRSPVSHAIRERWSQHFKGE